jgi:hypothetical protein
MTMTRTPHGKSAGHGTHSGPGNRDPGPDGGRIVRALTWARPGDAARASQFGALRTGRGKAASR